MTADRPRPDRRVTVRVEGPPGSAPISQLAVVAETLKNRSGIRLALHGPVLALSIAASRIEQLGPLIEAAAASNDLMLRLADLDALVGRADIEGWPSGIWAAIGDAALARELARARGEEPTGGLYEKVRVEEIDGTRFAVDGRPPRVEPVGPQPFDAGPTKYDDFDYHDGAAVDAGVPRENGFAHIAFYLTWLIRHDLHEPRAFARGRAEAIRRGEIRGTDLISDTDGKLMSDFMSGEGIAFSDARYRAYINAYDRVFPDAAPYSVVDDMANYALVATLIDTLYADWVKAGRPTSSET